MTVKEYFDLKGWGEKDCTKVFLKQAVYRDLKGMPSGEFCYRNTPIWLVWEWLENRRAGSKALDAIVLNPKAYADDWASGAGWNPQVERGDLQGILVADYDELCKKYTPQQIDETIAYIDKKICEKLGR